MNRSDPRVIKTKKQIDSALLENLSRHSFQKITVDMICASGMINRSTFYKYYRDKYDLLDSYLARVLHEFKERTVVDFILASPAKVGDPAYKDSFERLACYLYQHKDTYLILWSARMERRIYDEMTLLIKDQILDLLRKSYPDLGDSVIYAELYAHMFSSNAMGLIRWWFTNDRLVTLRDVTRIMTKNMEEGLFKTFRECLVRVDDGNGTSVCQTRG